MPEGGEGQQPDRKELVEHEAQSSERLPIQSVLSPEGAEANLIPFVSKELDHAAELRAQILDGEPSDRSPEYDLYRDLRLITKDIQHVHATYGGDSELPAAYHDLRAAQTAYALLAFPHFNEHDRATSLRDLWPDLQAIAKPATFGDHPGSGVGWPGIHLTERQANLVTVLTERAGMSNYEKPKFPEDFPDFISAKNAFAAWGTINDDRDYHDH